GGHREADRRDARRVSDSVLGPSQALRLGPTMHGLASIEGTQVGEEEVASDRAMLFRVGLRLLPRNAIPAPWTLDGRDEPLSVVFRGDRELRFCRRGPKVLPRHDVVLEPVGPHLV